MAIGFELYQTFLAFNLHFSKNTNYDYFKYHGKTKSTYESFLSTNFKWQFAALEKSLIQSQTIDQTELMYLLFKDNNFQYIKLHSKLFLNLNNILRHFSKKMFLENISNDFKYLFDSYDSYDMIVESEQIYPNIYREYKNKAIAIETLLLYNIHLHEFLVQSASNDIITWPSELARFERIQPFVDHLISKDEFDNYIMKKLI